MGVIDNPFDAASLALGAEATFVARTVDVQSAHLQSMLRRAVEHKGTSFVEILQNCVVFNDGAFDDVTDRDQAADHQLLLEHGEPLLFGKERKKGIHLNSKMEPEIVSFDDVAPEDILVHDESNDALSYFLTRLERPQFPLPLGVLRAIERPTYEEQVHAQINAARAKSGKADFDALFASGDTWVVD